MQIEELYKTLYSKYAPDLSQEELDKKLAYASTLEPNDFVNNFYQKYTGQGPTKENIDYMNTLLDQAQPQEEKKPMTEYEAREVVIDALPFGYKLAGYFDSGVNIIKDLINKPEEREQTLEVAKNAVKNVKPRLMATGLKIATGIVDLTTADLDNLGYNEKQRKIRDEAEDFMKQKYKEIESIEKYLVKDTGEGIVKGIKQGDASDLIGGIINANTSMVETVVPAMLTSGVSLPFQVIAPMYSDYNKAKAKAIYGEDDPDAMDKLIDNDQTELAVPAALGLFATSLEYVGFKGITKAIFSNPGARSFGAKLFFTGNREGLTEWGQGGIEAANTAFGEGKNALEASTALVDNMFSEKGVESYLNGFVGSSGVTTAGSAINRALRSDNASIKDVNNKINFIADLNYAKNQSKETEVKEAISVEIKEAEQDLKNYINEKRKLNKVLAAEEKTSLINILNEKDGIKQKAENLKAKLENGNITNKEFGYAIRSLNNQDKKLSDQLSGIQSAAVTRAADVVTETVKEQIKETGLEGEVVEMTSEEISNIKEEGFNSKEAAKQFGFINQRTDGSFTITLNKDKPMVGTAAHEFMHAVLFKTLGNNQNLQDSLGDALVDHVSDLGGETSVLGERLKAYGKFNKDGVFERDANFGEETITIMSEEIINGNLKFNENFFTKIGDIVRRFSQNYLGKEITFDTGRDVYNFVKDYSKSIKDGKINKAILKVAKEGAKGKLVEGKADPKAAMQMSKEASDNVQRIYDEQGEAGAMDIIDAFKPITNKLVQRRSEAPNFDRQLLTDEIETGKRGIFDLIREYKPESGVPLAAYINKFLPARAIEASQRVLGEEFTDDVSERVDIAAEEVTTETKAKPKLKKIVLADRLNVKSKVDKAIKEKLSELDIENLNFKTLKDQTPEITGEIFGISPKKLISGANITKKELQSAQMFINKNADVLISMLPEGATASGTATGVPQTLLKAFYTKTDRAKMAKTGTKAGLAIQVKNDIKKTDFLETFGIVDGKPDRTDRNTSARVLALANQTGKMMTNQAVREQLSESITEENAKSMLKLSDGKSAVMFSKNNAKENNMPNIVDYFGNKTEADVANILDQHASLTEEQFKKQFPSEHGNVKNYIEDMAQFVADGGKEAMQFTKEMKDTNFGNSELNNYLKTGYWNLSDAKFKQDKKAIKWFESNAHDLANQILLPENATNGNMRIIMGFFAGHYNIVGSDMAKVGSTLKQGILDRLNKKGKSVLSKKTLDRWKNFDFENLKSSYASTFYTGLKKIYAANSLKEQKAIAKEYFTGKEGATQKDFYDLWNTTLEEWLYSSEVGSKEFNSKADYILKLKKANAAIGTTGERIMAPGGYVYLPGSIMDGRVKFEHLKSSSQQSKESALLVINNKFKEFGDLATEEYTGIYGPLELFNAIDEATGRVNSSNIFRLAGNLEAAKNIYSIDNLNQSLYDEIISTIGKDKIKLLERAVNKEQVKKLNKAVMFSRSANNPSKGITVLDFDDTLATTKSLVKYTTPDGKTGTLNAEEYASTYEDLLDQGFIFDFSDFNKVVKGKLAPLFNKAIKLQGKFGPENMFVLTARPPQAAKAIFDFLKANGLNIPLKNITGLGNSTAEAKALWVADKVGEGYNDFYFADDALQNVQAVKNMLDQFDVKSKVQQAKVKFSKGMNDQFNSILEDVTKIDAGKRFSEQKARKRGANKGKFRLFIPPSHEDFVGLLYNFMGKGRKGDQHRDFFEQALVRPLNRAYREIDTAKQAIANDYKELNKQFADVKKKLRKKTPDGDYIFEDAVRIYLWNKHGYDIPGLSKTDQANLSELVMSDPQLQAYAETLNVISKQDTYVEPGKGWDGGNIKTDLIDATGRVGRAQYFTEFNENADVIFSPENLNKIEAAYGGNFRSAVEDILHRIKTGVNRPKGQSGTVNAFMNYLNGSVGTVMFFNVRSAILQQMSIVNYINFADNNIFAAGKAFANQPQYWKDFAFIFNSDMLKQRRGGIGTDINGADLAQAVAGSKNPTKIVISKLLKLGFLPTQIGDNIAIATGGATFYRNRINKYIKDGLSKKEAETRAFTDFQDLTQSTQQSSRPDMTSQQQASWIGKLVLNFQNITSQYNRIIKKAALDIGKGRISPPYTTRTQSNLGNLSKILYYGAIQNVIFYSLQTALFAVMFDDDEDEDQILKKRERVIQGSIDSILRGAGIYGAVASTLKNAYIRFKEQREKGYNKDESAVPLELANFSPVVGIKLRQLVNAEKTLNYNENVIGEMETFEADNPMWSAVTNYTQALTNFPANRLYQKSINMRNALDKDYTNFQRVLFFSGYTTWSLGLGDTEAVVEAKEKVKINKENARKEKRIQKKIEKIEANKSIVEENKKKKDGRCAAISTSGKRCSNEAISDGFCSIHEKVEQREDGKKLRCRKTKSDGTRCRVMTTNKSQYCYYHD